MYILSFVFRVEYKSTTNSIGVIKAANNDYIFDQNRITIENITKKY